jgi:hypothetical protein
MASGDLVTVDVNKLLVDLGKLQGRLGNHSVSLRRFQNYMRTTTYDHFSALGQGGTHRGVTWKYFQNPVYVRKTDGQAVPPWGGVPRLARLKQYRGTTGFRASELGSFSNRNRGSGSSIVRDRRSTLGEKTVRGRLRASGKRLKQGDQILRDTDELVRSVANSIGQNSIRDIGPVEMKFGTMVPYAEKQNRTRPFLFFTEEDRKTAERMVYEGLIGGSRGGTG